MKGCELEDFLNRNLDPLKDSVDLSVGQLYLQERYETEAGIYNHDISVATEIDSSLAILGMHPAEDIMSYSGVRKRMIEYIEADVKEYFGLDFYEFLAQPRYTLDLMLELCAIKQREKHQIEQKKINELEQHKT